MTTEQFFNLERDEVKNVVFEVDYSTIQDKHIRIIGIKFRWDFEYKYEDGKLTNWAIAAEGSCWNNVGMYIYN